MINFNLTFVSIECPICNYKDEIQLVDAKSEKVIFCLNCKENIKLSDSEASVHNGIENMNKALKDLENIFKRFGK